MTPAYGRFRHIGKILKGLIDEMGGGKTLMCQACEGRAGDSGGWPGRAVTWGALAVGGAGGWWPGNGKPGRWVAERLLAGALAVGVRAVGGRVGR